MIEEITSNPSRGSALVDKEGLPNRQLIEWFDDIELKINEIINQRNRLDEFTVLTVPTASENQTLQIYITDETGGPTPAYSDGTNWRRYSDGNIIS